MKQTSTTRPKEVAITKGKNEWFLTVCYNIEEEVKDGETIYSYDCATVKLYHKPSTDRGTLVSAIVRTRFSADAVEAIVQNHISEETEGHQREWEVLQAWRKEAKRMALEYLGAGNEP